MGDNQHLTSQFCKIESCPTQNSKKMLPQTKNIDTIKQDNVTCYFEGPAKHDGPGCSAKKVTTILNHGKIKSEKTKKMKQRSEKKLLY